MKIFLKVLKGLMYLASAVCFVFFLINLIGGIYNACVADDIITAQDRVQGAYSFMRMLIFIFASVLLLFLTLLIKEKLFPFIEKAPQEEVQEEVVEEQAEENKEDAPIEQTETAPEEQVEMGEAE